MYLWNAHVRISGYTYASKHVWISAYMYICLEDMYACVYVVTYIHTVYVGV
jgi:hypothetical protein